MDIFRNRRKRGIHSACPPRRTLGFGGATWCRDCLADISVPRAVPRRANPRGGSGEPPTAGARLRKVPRSTWLCRRPPGSEARKPLRCVEERSTRPELLLLVLSGQELHTVGDARIRGKEQPADSRASCRPLLRFVQLDSEWRLDRAAADGWFRQEGAVSPCAPAHRPQRASRLLAGMRAASPDAADGYGRCHSTMRDRRLGGPDESAIGTETARVMP